MLLCAEGTYRIVQLALRTGRQPVLQVLQRAEVAQFGQAEQASAGPVGPPRACAELPFTHSLADRGERTARNERGLGGGEVLRVHGAKLIDSGDGTHYALPSSQAEPYLTSAVRLQRSTPGPPGPALTVRTDRRCHVAEIVHHPVIATAYPDWDVAPLVAVTSSGRFAEHIQTPSACLTRRAIRPHYAVHRDQPVEPDLHSVIVRRGQPHVIGPTPREHVGHANGDVLRLPVQHRPHRLDGVAADGEPWTEEEG